jgi:hypothetical protein
MAAAAKPGVRATPSVHRLHKWSLNFTNGVLRTPIGAARRFLHEKIP